MFGVTFLPVLWSPAGAPIAGVPGPRRSADECDAGWFAPVATRRRSMLRLFQSLRRRLAAHSGGHPPDPPTGRRHLAAARQYADLSRSTVRAHRSGSPAARSAPKTARRTMPWGLQPPHQRPAAPLRPPVALCRGPSGLLHLRGADGRDAARPFRMVGPGPAGAPALIRIWAEQASAIG